MQVALEPFDGLQIEMVGGLIQGEDVGLFKKKACQQSARALPAAEQVQRTVDVYVVQAQPIEHGADLDLVQVPPGVLERLLQAPITIHGVCSLFGIGQQCLQCLQASLHLLQLSKYGTAQVPRRLTASQVHVLWQVADAHVVHTDHVAACGRLLPDQDVQEGRLALAIRSDEGDLFAVGNAHADVLKDVLNAE